MNGSSWLKVLVVILSAGIVLVSGLYIDLFYQLKEQGVELEKQAEELEALTTRYDRLSGFSELVNLTLKQPAITKFVGIFVVSGYYLECGSTGIEPEFKLGSAYYGRDIAIIYSPLDNLTLKLSLQITSEPGLYVPLTVQYGDVFRLEFGVPIAVWNETIIEWQAPILWSIDANETGVYEVLLPSKGWHTISLVGPISTNRFGVSHGGIGIKWENDTLRLIERFNIRLEFKVLKNGEPILFAVRPLRWL